MSITQFAGKRRRVNLRIRMLGVRVPSSARDGFPRKTSSLPFERGRSLKRPGANSGANRLCPPCQGHLAVVDVVSRKLPTRVGNSTSFSCDCYLKRCVVVSRKLPTRVGNSTSFSCNCYLKRCVIGSRKLPTRVDSSTLFCCCYSTPDRKFDVYLMCSRLANTEGTKWSDFFTPPKRLLKFLVSLGQPCTACLRQGNWWASKLDVRDVSQDKPSSDLQGILRSRPVRHSLWGFDR